nr:MAG TPA: hypothetical protein [Ackermannviridae sp.]
MILSDSTKYRLPFIDIICIITLSYSYSYIYGSS